MNYFERFGLPVSLSVDSAALSRKYFELQKQYHPDFFAQDDEAAQQEALEQSAAINKALKVLKKQDSTIEYVLQLKGLIEKDEKYPLPPDFLMEVMELNENLEAGALAAFEQSIYAEASPVIEHYNDATATADDLQKLKAYYYKKKYLQRILDRMDG